MLRKLKKPFFFVFLLAVCYFLAEGRTDGFRTPKILFKVNYKTNLRKKVLCGEKRTELEKILSKKFVYLGRGRQSFVFESGEYVIKFLNYRNIYYPKFLRFLKIPVLQKSLDRKDRRFPMTFDSIALCYDRLSYETALIYSNIGKDRLNKKLKLNNRYGQEFEIDLDSTYFVLQRKVKPLYETLNGYYERGGEKALKLGINSFLGLIFSRCEKFIADDDLNSGKNCGFLGKRAVIIDVGKLYLDESLKEEVFFRGEVFRSVKFFRRWLLKNYPDLVTYLDEKMEERFLKYR
jgi:hypothetical protein